jgi:aminopeptidase
MPDPQTIRALAELVVRFGANLQPGQILAISTEPGKEELARAVAEVAYEQQAQFVDLSVFDVYFKRARILHAAPDTLDFVPPWYGERMRALGEHRCARIAFTGPVAPHALDGLDPTLVGRDILPATREGMELLNARSTNWTAVPGPTCAWASIVYPDLDAEAALERLWGDVAHVCRLDEPDPVVAWTARLDALVASAAKLSERRFDAIRFEGPGTDLEIGLLPGSRWHGARLETAQGIVHVPNLPTEEVFTTPDPARTNGVVRATKPLFAAGTLIEGIRVRFEAGRAVEIDADRGADTLRALTDRDEGSARLGEVALVDREGRIGPLNTVFFDTLLDENAASHIALGQGFAFAVEEADRDAINSSQIHVDFMIGGDDVAVMGITASGEAVPVLRQGSWQI